MFQRIDAGAGGEHPAIEQARPFGAVMDFGDFQKGGSFRRFLRRAFQAFTRPDGDAAENNRLANGNGEILRSCGNLVEGPEHDNLAFRPFFFLLELGLGLRE
tara:strand:- start:29270 stop:29575 length:306 start_codon:yes stop_codon:yes gene_type:complete